MALAKIRAVKQYPYTVRVIGVIRGKELNDEYYQLSKMWSAMPR